MVREARAGIFGGTSIGRSACRGSFAIPVQATLDGSRVTVKNVAPEMISRAFVFESRGGKAGFRTLQDLKGEATVDRPELVAGPQSIQRDLEKALVAQGLFEKEA